MFWLSVWYRGPGKTLPFPARKQVLHMSGTDAVIPQLPEATVKYNDKMCPKLEYPVFSNKKRLCDSLALTL